MTDNIKPRWIVRCLGGPLGAGAGWECHWPGPGPRPIGPCGEQVGPFNTTFAKAAAAARSFNDQLDQQERDAT